MATLLESGWLIDMILLATLLEGLALSIFYLKTGKGLAPKGLIFNLLAGACLLLALRAALTAADWVWIALCLLAALVAHLFDLKHRWLS